MALKKTNPFFLAVVHQDKILHVTTERISLGKTCRGEYFAENIREIHHSPPLCVHTYTYKLWMGGNQFYKIRVPFSNRGKGGK